MLSNIIKGVRDVLKMIGPNSETIRGLAANSMVQYTRATRCEPITMIDHRIIHDASLPDLMATLTTIYAAMYSQSFSLAINQEIGDIKIMKTLEKINPNRSKLEAGLALASGLESHSLTLPDYSKIEENFKIKNTVSMEFAAPEYGDKVGNVYGSADSVANGNNKTQQLGNTKEVDVDTDAITKFHSNLSTGILFNVEVQATDRTVTVPIQVHLLANSLGSDNVLSLLESAVKNRTAKERYREWRAGGLSFWKDVVLCRDILRADRKKMIKDKTGMIEEIVNRRNNNRIAGLFSGNPSISNVSNILVVSKETINEFQRQSHKKITDHKVRDTIFNSTQIMIMAVVDPDYETVTLYYHDINVASTATFKDIKSKNGKGNLDPMEVLRAYQMGNGIRL